MQIQINGTVEPGFESVKKLYEHNMQALAERNTQICVYHKGKKVADLMRHEGGLASFNVSVDAQDLLTSSIKQNKWTLLSKASVKNTVKMWIKKENIMQSLAAG